MAIIYLGFHNPPKWFKPYYPDQIKLEFKQKELPFEFVKCESKQQRCKFKIDRLNKFDPKLAERVAVVHSRAKDLESEHNRNATWALAMGNRANLAIVAIALFYLIFIPPSANGDGANSGGNLPTTLFSKLTSALPRPLVIIAVIFALMQSFAYFNKYAAMVKARGEFTAIVTNIENGTIIYALGADKNSKHWEKVDKSVNEWASKIGATTIKYGGNLAKTSTLLVLPGFFGGSNK